MYFYPLVTMRSSFHGPGSSSSFRIITLLGILVADGQWMNESTYLPSYLPTYLPILQPPSRLHIRDRSEISKIGFWPRAQEGTPPQELNVQPPGSSWCRQQQCPQLLSWITHTVATLSCPPLLQLSFLEGSCHNSEGFEDRHGWTLPEHGGTPSLKVGFSVILLSHNTAFGTSHFYKKK